MNCSTCKRIWVQAGVIVAVGTAIGAYDAFARRPISLGREAPPQLDLTKLSPGDSAKPPVATAPPASTPAPSQSTPTSPTTPPSPTPNPSPTPTPATAGAGGVELTPKDKMPAGHITVDEARALYDSGATFIDTRKSDVYQAGHVANAYRIELAMFSAGDPPMMAMIPRDAFVVVYCVGGHCDESEAVARMLDGSGYKKVYVMHDGFPGWQAKGFPVETGKGMDQ